MNTAPITASPRLGLPLHLIILLGLLAAPRVVLHDLKIVSEGTPVNALLVFVPLLAWVAVAVWRATNPFLALLVTGGIYGLCLALVHNVLWSHTWEGSPPRLGGNLAGRFPIAVDELLLRAAMSISSLFTGLAVGAICGAVAWALSRILRRVH